MPLPKPTIALIIIFMCGGISGTLHAQNKNWEVPEQAKTLENPMEHSDQIVTAGKQIFGQLCAVCHGKSGKGDGVTAASLKPKPADLSSELVQKQTDGAIYWKIREGRPPMPSFKSQLSEKQVWALVIYIRSLTNTN